MLNAPVEKAKRLSLGLIDLEDLAQGAAFLGTGVEVIPISAD